MAATKLLTPNSDSPKHVAGLTSTRRATSSGAAAATRSARHPPNDSPTNVTYKQNITRLHMNRQSAAWTPYKAPALPPPQQRQAPTKRLANQRYQ